MPQISEIESELESILKSETTRFMKIYELLEEVEKDKLYEPNFRSFSAYVNNLATRMGVHVSLLWTRKKAGKVFTEYQERLKHRDNSLNISSDLPDVSELKVAPESIALCSTIAGKNTDRLDQLVDKVVRGELKRKDLREIAQATRQERQEQREKRKAAREAGNDEESEERAAAEISDQPAASASGSAIIRAEDVLIALQQPGWLSESDLISQEKQEKSWKSWKYVEEIYSVFPEFPTYTGSSRHARRMDAMIVESLTVEHPQEEVCLRGIEIKVSKSDLLHDDKMAEYTEFCDFFYIAIPETEEMIEAALSYKDASWGIIVCKDGQAKIHTPAQKLSPVFRDKSLAVCIIKLASKARLDK